MPGDAHRQYRRNLSRAAASVAAARVSTVKRLLAGARASTSNVQVIFTSPGWAYVENCSAGIGWNTTFPSHGRHAAPAA